MKKFLKLTLAGALMLCSSSVFAQKFGRVDLAVIIPNMAKQSFENPQFSFNITRSQKIIIMHNLLGLIQFPYKFLIRSEIIHSRQHFFFVCHNISQVYILTTVIFII